MAAALENTRFFNDWGSRGREFKSRHSDHRSDQIWSLRFFIVSSVGCVHSTAGTPFCMTVTRSVQPPAPIGCRGLLWYSGAKADASKQQLYRLTAPSAARYEAGNRPYFRRISLPAPQYGSSFPYPPSRGCGSKVLFQDLSRPACLHVRKRGR